MDRKELYSKINEIGNDIKNAIKECYGDNYTRISSDKLKAFLDDWIGTCCANETKESKENNVESNDVESNKTITTKGVANQLIKLVATLQLKRIITKSEAVEILAELSK